MCLIRLSVQLCGKDVWSHFCGKLHPTKEENQRNMNKKDEEKKNKNKRKKEEASPARDIFTLEPPNDLLPLLSLSLSLPLSHKGIWLY